MKKNIAFGYEMTFRQACKLSKLLSDNILERYDNPEYHDQDIIDEFAHNNRLKPQGGKI